MRRVVVASQNPDKIREVEAVLSGLDEPFEVVTGLEWPEIDEPYDTLEANAIHKARMVVGYTGMAALADDTGLEVAALDGAPGVFTARFAGPDATYADNVAKLVRELDGVSDRSARFRTVVALVYTDSAEVTAEGVLDGRIALEPRGSYGFGYDPVFEVEAMANRTLAEIPEHEKNQISHRALALHELARILSEPSQP
ncbi:MAG: RdgB/HAM1 family non-canonical purine NTP pyrophosphatase [Acidimicrobiia bacterium]|nr:RdgB/HAM1 family non-canonical purine NTP pyrophosphatase [Acidimicrobiia bacterium]